MYIRVSIFYFGPGFVGLEYVDLGCFVDGVTDDTKVLPEQGTYQPAWNISLCLQYCLKYSLFYFGTSKPWMCFCGNGSSNYSRYGACSDSADSNSNIENIKIYEVVCDLDVLENGNITRSYRTATFECDQGFTLSGNHTLTCITFNNSIIWDGAPPICKKEASLSYLTTKSDIDLTEYATGGHSSDSTTTTTTSKEGMNNPSINPAIGDMFTTRQGESTEGRSTKAPSILSYISTNEASTTVVNQTTDNPFSVDSQMIFNILIAIIPVVVITFFLVLSRCYKDEDPKRKRRSMGESVCGPSSFEYLTPRVVKRQFSSEVPMTYNKSLSMYSSKDDVDQDSETLIESEFHGDDDINFDGNYDPQEIVYV